VCAGLGAFFFLASGTDGHTFLAFHTFDVLDALKPQSRPVFVYGYLPERFKAKGTQYVPAGIAVKITAVFPKMP